MPAPVKQKVRANPTRKKKAKKDDDGPVALSVGEKLCNECMKYAAEIEAYDARQIRVLLGGSKGLKGSADPNYRRDEGGWRPVHYCAYNGSAHGLRALLARAQTLVNVYNDLGTTPLHLAATAGHAECVRILLEAGARPNVISGRRVTMQFEFPGGKPKKWKKLNPMRLWMLDNLTVYCAHPLSQMIYGKPFVKVMLSPHHPMGIVWRGCEVYFVEPHSPAAKAGVQAGWFVREINGLEAKSARVVQKRLRNAKRSSEDEIPLEFSTRLRLGWRMVGIHNEWVWTKAEYHEAIRNALETWQFEDEVTERGGLLVTFADTNDLRAPISTPLHGAALGGHVACVEALIAAGADLEATDGDGRTPLHWAGLHGGGECCELLIRAGAQCVARDRWGENPIHVVPRHEKHKGDGAADKLLKMGGRFSLRRIARVFWDALTSTGMAASHPGSAKRALEAVDPRLTIVFPRGMYERPAGFAVAEARKEYREVLAQHAEAKKAAKIAREEAEKAALEAAEEEEKRAQGLLPPLKTTAEGAAGAPPAAERDDDDDDDDDDALSLGDESEDDDPRDDDRVRLVIAPGGGGAPTAADDGDDDGPPKTIRGGFDVIDKDGNGEVTRAEFITVLRKPENEWLRECLGLPAKIHQEDGAFFEAVDKVFRSIDGDVSRELSYDEWENFCRVNDVLDDGERAAAAAAAAAADAELKAAARARLARSRGEVEAPRSQDEDLYMQELLERTEKPPEPKKGRWFSSPSRTEVAPSDAGLAPSEDGGRPKTPTSPLSKAQIAAKKRERRERERARKGPPAYLQCFEHIKATVIGATRRARLCFVAGALCVCLGPLLDIASALEVYGSTARPGRSVPASSSMPSARDGEPPRRILGMMLLALAMLPNALVASLRGQSVVARVFDLTLLRAPYEALESWSKDRETLMYTSLRVSRAGVGPLLLVFQYYAVRSLGGEPSSVLVLSMCVNLVGTSLTTALLEVAPAAARQAVRDAAAAAAAAEIEAAKPENRRARGEADARRMFQLIDVDGDGELTRGELKKALRENEEVRQLLQFEKGQTIGELIGRMDGDNDNVVSPDELVEFVVSAIKDAAEKEEASPTRPRKKRKGSKNAPPPPADGAPSPTKSRAVGGWFSPLKTSQSRSAVAPSDAPSHSEDEDVELGGGAAEPVTLLGDAAAEPVAPPASPPPRQPSFGLTMALANRRTLGPAGFAGGFGDADKPAEPAKDPFAVPPPTPYSEVLLRRVPLAQDPLVIVRYAAEMALRCGALALAGVAISALYAGNGCRNTDFEELMLHDNLFNPVVYRITYTDVLKADGSPYSLCETMTDIESCENTIDPYWDEADLQEQCGNSDAVDVEEREVVNRMLTCWWYNGQCQPLLPTDCSTYTKADAVGACVNPASGADCNADGLSPCCWDPAKYCCECGGGDSSIAAVPGDDSGYFPVEFFFVVLLFFFCLLRAWIVGYYAEEPPIKYYWPYDGFPSMSFGTRECLGSVLWFFIPIFFTLPAEIPDPGLPVIYSRKLGENTFWLVKKEFTIAPNPFIVLFCWPAIPCYGYINLCLRPRFNEYAPIPREPRGHTPEISEVASLPLSRSSGSSRSSPRSAATRSGAPSRRCAARAASRFSRRACASASPRPARAT